MKTLIFSVLLAVIWGTCFAQPIPPDSLYLAKPLPGNYPVVFPLQFSGGLRPVERVSISSDGKEIYYGELNDWPATTQKVNCYKYMNNMWQGPFVVFDGYIAPALSPNDSILYVQKDVNGTGCAFYSTRTATGWTAPVKMLSSNLQSHYFRKTQLNNYYLASNPNSNSDICRLVIQNSDTIIQSLGKPINTNMTENDFFIARDESYIIFFRLYTPYDLFISYHKSNGSWTNPKSLGVNINTTVYDCCPYVTNDNKYLFFSRGWATPTFYTYWVKIDNVIDSLKYTNYVPYVKYQIPNIADTIGKVVNYTFPDSTFIDDDGNNTLTYNALLSGGGALPSWINFNPSTRKFTFTLNALGTTELKVTATDNANASISCNFYITVINNTSIHSVSGQVVNTYNLYQNYPNPFNPVTKIKFSIPENNFVSLKVYDINGKEVDKIFSGNLKSGIYESDFDASKLSSGIYFYKLDAGNFSEIKKMVVLK